MPLLATLGALRYAQVLELRHQGEHVLQSLLGRRFVYGLLEKLDHVSIRRLGPYALNNGRRALHLQVRAALLQHTLQLAHLCRGKLKLARLLDGIDCFTR